jgi:hypothetical protein
VAVVFGSIASLIGVAFLLGGLALILAHAFARDSDGYYTTGTERLATVTYALTAEDIDLGSRVADVVPKDVLGRVRIRAQRPGGRPVFVGIGPEREVDAYLRGVPMPRSTTSTHPGTGRARAARPAARRQLSGSGSRGRRGRGDRRSPGRSRVDTGPSWP